jgi:alpha-N-arabinofuranosidase
MFSVNRGTYVLSTSPVSSAGTAPLYWVASYNNNTNTAFLKVGFKTSRQFLDLIYFSKVSNGGTQDIATNIVLDFIVPSHSGTAISLRTTSGVLNISNTIDQPQNIAPVSSSFAISSANGFSYTFPATSVTVIVLDGVSGL